MGCVVSFAKTIVEIASFIMQTKDILIIGGSSGLGLELAKKYKALGHRIIVGHHQRLKASWHIAR